MAFIFKLKLAARRRRLILALTIALPMSVSAALLWNQPGQAPLPANAAFRLLPAYAENGSLHLRWDIAPGYFLYRDRLKLSVAEPAAGVRLTPEWPTADRHSDGEGGTVAIYRNRLELAIVAPASVTRLRVRYQGCADAGLCYPPIETTITVTTP